MHFSIFDYLHVVQIMVFTFFVALDASMMYIEFDIIFEGSVAMFCFGNPFTFILCEAHYT